MKKRIAIICTLDGFANSTLPLNIKSFLEIKGHDVELINTFNLNKTFTDEKSTFLIFKYSLLLFLNKIIGTAIEIQSKYLKWSYKFFYYYLLRISMWTRAKILFNLLDNKKFDLIIGESQIDSEYFLNKLNTTTLYNCTTPWADELYYGNFISKKQYLKFLQRELIIYSRVTYLSFHSDVYADYVNKYYYKGDNIVNLHNGINRKKIHAKYAKPIRIVYMGYLGGYWINLPLLSRLSQLYKYIDVYGSPEPPKKYNLNYRGYSNTSILTKYQLGLITLSKDKLRREGFSAKHIQYISYGLPVLMPEWRPNAIRIKGTIMYNEENFLEKIEYFSKKNNWLKISKQALQQSKKYEWNNVLLPLNKIIEKIN